MPIVHPNRDVPEGIGLQVVTGGKRDSLDYGAGRRKSPTNTYALTWEGAGNGA